MTDNEKRAHDIAVASAILLANEMFKDTDKNGKSKDCTVSFYSLYKKSYDV